MFSVDIHFLSSTDQFSRCWMLTSASDDAPMASDVSRITTTSSQMSLYFQPEGKPNLSTPHLQYGSENKEKVCFIEMYGTSPINIFLIYSPSPAGFGGFVVAAADEAEIFHTYFLIHHGK